MRCAYQACKRRIDYVCRIKHSRRIRQVVLLNFAKSGAFSTTRGTDDKLTPVIQPRASGYISLVAN
jgi:hypothetical protein